MSGRVRSFSSRSGWASCLSRIAGVPLQGLKSAAAFILCPCAGVSGLLVHDEWRGSSFPSEKAFSASCERGTEGVVTDRVRSEPSRSGQALCWPRIAEIPLQGLTSAVALVLRIHTGVSELLAHDEWGGLLPCLGRHSLRPENGAESPRQVQSRHDLVCGWQLRGRSPKVRCLTRLGAHTNLDWVRRVCVYFGVCITTAVIEREFMNVRQADQAGTEPRGTHARGSMSVGRGRSREGQSTRMSVSLVPVSPHL